MCHHLCDATGSLEVLVKKSRRAALGLLKAVKVFLGMRVPNNAGVLHNRSNNCGVALGPSVSWAPSHVCLEECMASGLRAVVWMCFNHAAKFIVQLHAKVFGGVYSFQDMTMGSVVLLNDIAFVGNSQ